jgi:hypothetical protein
MLELFIACIYLQQQPGQLRNSFFVSRFILGLCAARIGSMDELTLKMISTQLEALLPTTGIELPLSHTTQVWAHRFYVNYFPGRRKPSFSIRFVHKY